MAANILLYDAHLVPVIAAFKNDKCSHRFHNGSEVARETKLLGYMPLCPLLMAKNEQKQREYYQLFSPTKNTQAIMGIKTDKPYGRAQKTDNDNVARYQVLCSLNR